MVWTAAALLPLATFVPAAGASAPNSASSSADLLAMVNNLRVSRGVAPLTPDPAIASPAQAWTDHMASMRTLAHNPNLAAQMPPGWTGLAENVGEGGDVKAIFNALVNSPSHYANMMNPSYNLTGVGVAWDASGTTYVTEDFAALVVPGGYVPVAPSRILDTRNGTGATAAPVGPGQTIDVQATGVGGVPTTGVSAVMLNVTVTVPTAVGYVTVYPSGSGPPLAASLTFSAGQTVPNLVVVRVGNGGRVSIFNAAGSAHVVADVSGWYSDGSAGSPAGGRYAAVAPSRVLDTRDGTGATAGPLGAGQAVDVQVAGLGGVPSTGVSAVALDVTVTGPSTMSYLTVSPSGSPTPLAANLVFVAGQTTTNMVVAKVGAGGKVSIFNAIGSAHVVVDIAGWYSDGSVAMSGGLFTSLAPSRILDTRNGTGGVSTPIGPGQSITFQVAGVNGVPTSGVSAVAFNVTATGPSSPGYVVVSPAGAAAPPAPSLTFTAGQTLSNLVVATLGAGGRVSIYNASGSTQVVADVAGWFSA